MGVSRTIVESSSDYFCSAVPIPADANREKPIGSVPPVSFGPRVGGPTHGPNNVLRDATSGLRLQHPACLRPLLEPKPLVNRTLAFVVSAVLAGIAVAAPADDSLIADMDTLKFTAPKGKGAVELVEGKVGKAVK